MKRFRVWLVAIGSVAIIIFVVSLFWPGSGDLQVDESQVERETEVAESPSPAQSSSGSGSGSGAAVRQASPALAKAQPPQHLTIDSPDFGSAAELFNRIESRVSGLDSISEARALVMRWLAAALIKGELRADELASQLADPSVSVMARIIYAEAMLGLVPEQIREIDNTPIAQTLAKIDAPVLSSLIIDVLAHSGQPELMPFVASKAQEYPENIRLSALNAARTYPDAPESLPLVESLLQDENYYRVRIASIRTIAHIAPQESLEQVSGAVDRERELLTVPPPEGQNRRINLELIEIAALKAIVEGNARAP